MAPRAHGRGGPPRAATPTRGGPPRGAIRGGLGGGPLQVGQTPRGVQAETVGVRRPNEPGKAGRRIGVLANHFAVSFDDRAGSYIYHYDVAITSSQSGAELKLPIRFNHQIIDKLQRDNADIFRPPAAYDGRKNLFASMELALGPTHSKTFDVVDPDHNGNGNGNGKEDRRAPKVYKVKITAAKNNKINREVLSQFVQGRHPQDEVVLTALTTLNVAVRALPIKLPGHAYNVRSIFSEQGMKEIGNGHQLWRGFFQSVRPCTNTLTVNIDIATAVMYKPGELIDLCLEFFSRGPNPAAMLGSSIPDRERLRLQRFLSGLRICARSAGTGREVAKTIKRLSSAGANQLTFSDRDGKRMSVADYFRQNGHPLRFPGIICIEVGSGALIPLEMCRVPKGQIIRKQLAPEKTREVVSFSAMPPRQRRDAIMNAFQTFQYTQSEYVQQFGMRVNQQMMRVSARVLNPPTLRYGGTRQPTVNPRNGAWNMVDKKLFKPATVQSWVLVIFEPRFGPRDAETLHQRLVSKCQEMGITFAMPQPYIRNGAGQGDIIDQLKNIGRESIAQTKKPPSFFVVVLPDGANEIYTAVKHFGDCDMGVPTQCLRSNKCRSPADQYLANVALKINVKLGGINLIPDQQSAGTLLDPRVPTIIMGADTAHPPPGSEGRPSFTALVSSVDSQAARYVAATRVQAGRTEMIADLQDMVKSGLQQYIGYQKGMEGVDRKPARLIFYRDGVSEGQFQEVKDSELAAIQRACSELGIKPKITFIIVGKRHHTRLFPEQDRDGDNKGNCHAGTVVDEGIVHPLEFDFYLQSHAAIIGTARSAHYSVLHDDNGFNVDTIQALSFVLCHVYARATRSVSIPAPVYYADLVCGRAKNHYNPNKIRLDDSASIAESNATQMLESYQTNFVPLHKNQERLMYFS